MERTPSDTDMLDWLEAQNGKARYTGTCVFRWSRTGRGWRLHETSDASLRLRRRVRDAIRDAMTAEAARKDGE